MGHFQKQCHRQRFNILWRSFISSFLWNHNDQLTESNEHWDAQSQVDGMSINILEVQQFMKKRGKMYFKCQMRGMTRRQVFSRHPWQRDICRDGDSMHNTHTNPGKTNSQRGGREVGTNSPLQLKRYWHLFVSGSRRVNCL